MKLTELDAKFLKRIDSHNFVFVETIGEADGVEFLCPKCFQKNSGPIGTHAVICWKSSVPQNTSPTPGRWPMTGTSLSDLTLSPSIQVGKANDSGCGAHFFIQNGQITGLT